jgi:hypothetical protein
VGVALAGAVVCRGTGSNVEEAAEVAASLADLADEPVQAFEALRQSC